MLHVYSNLALTPSDHVMIAPPAHQEKGDQPSSTRQHKKNHAKIPLWSDQLMRSDHSIYLLVYRHDALKEVFSARQLAASANLGLKPRRKKALLTYATNQTGIARDPSDDARGQPHTCAD